MDSQEEDERWRVKMEGEASDAGTLTADLNTSNLPCYGRLPMERIVPDCPLRQGGSNVPRQFTSPPCPRHLLAQLRDCMFITACQTAPRHPAYPHRWHWSYEAAHFPNALLILRSWVGSTVFGQAHTGCPSYTVHPRQLHPLHDHHLQYLTLEAKKHQLDTLFTQLEKKERWTSREEATFTQTLQHYQAVLAEQAELRTLPDTLACVAAPITGY